MTDKEINETIHRKLGLHESVGLKKRGLWWRPNDKGYTSRVEEAGRYTLEEAKEREHVDGCPEDVTVHALPAKDYCGDRNAIYEAIQTLSPSQKADLAMTLARIMGKQFNPCGWIDLVCDTTARQYAEAFLRTYQGAQISPQAQPCGT